MLLVSLSLVDFAANVWPPLLSDVRWRFGAAGLLANFLLTPLLGLWLAGLAAQIMQHRLAGRVVAAIDMALALGFIVIAVEFVLAGLELKPREAPPEAIWTYNVGMAKGVLKYVLVSGALGWLSLVGWRGTRKAGGADAGGASGPRILVRHSDTEVGE